MRVTALPIYCLFILLVTSGAYAATTCKHDPTTLRCVKYLSNYDADTLTLEIPRVHPLLGHRAKVRVMGVDSPEIRTENPCEKEKARAAKRLVAELLKRAKRINLENVAREKYFRILADVTVDGVSLAKVLLERGIAVRYMGRTKPQVDWCQSYEAIAQMNALPQPSVEPPVTTVE